MNTKTVIAGFLAAGAVAVGLVAVSNGVSLGASTAPTVSCTTSTPPPPPTGTLRVDASSPPVALKNGNNVVGPLGYPFEVTTASFSPPAHAVLVAMTAQNNYASDSYYDTTLSYVDNDPTALVWTRQSRSDWPTSGTQGGSEIWTATTGDVAPGPITVSAESNYSQGSTADWLALQVQVVTDTSGTTPVVGGNTHAAHTNSLPSASLVLGSGSLGFAAVSDWNANGGTSVLGAGLTAIANGRSPGINGNGPDYAYHFFKGSTNTFNMTSPSPQTWNETVVEVKP